MTVDTLVPDRIRRRYSAKLVVALGVVVAATLAVGVLFTIHVQSTAENGQIPVETAISAIAGFQLVVVFHLGIVGIVMGGNVALALNQLGEKAERIGAGDLGVEFETDRVDEVGRLFVAFATMRDSLRVTLEDLSAQRERALEAQQATERRNEALSAEAERFSSTMEACANGDLRRRLDPETDDEAMAAIADAFNEMVDELAATVGDVQGFARTVDEASTEVQTGAAEIRRASREIASAMQEIADGASTQSDDLEVATSEISALSATAEEMASTASTIAEQSARVASLADAGLNDAGEAADAMRDAEERTDELADAIRTLNEDAAQIGSVLKLIDDIAKQTNMLALNASLESARSHQGASGSASGFDAVAEEVKQLAGQVQDAVDEIEDTLQSIEAGAATSADGIEAVQGQLDTASGRVVQLNEQLEEIATDIDRVDDSIQLIDDATNDQSTSAQELATIVEDVASVAAETSAQAQDVAAASQEATATTETVSDEASVLDDRADRLAATTATFEVPDGVRSSESDTAPNSESDGGASDRDTAADTESGAVIGSDAGAGGGDR